MDGLFVNNTFGFPYLQILFVHSMKYVGHFMGLFLIDPLYSIHIYQSIQLNWIFQIETRFEFENLGKIKRVHTKSFMVEIFGNKFFQKASYPSYYQRN